MEQLASTSTVAASTRASIDLGARPFESLTSVSTNPAQVQAAERGQSLALSLASPATQLDAGDAGNVAGQLVQAIRLQVRNGIGEARLRLRPEHLGEVHIDLKVDRDKVSAVLQVERPDVRAYIEGQGQTLRAGLAAQGLHLEELTVRDDESRREERRQPDQQSNRRRRQTPNREFQLEE
jgi:flagellar hook-length control protein FliK